MFLKVSLEKGGVFLAEQGHFWGSELGSSLRLTSTLFSLKNKCQPPGFLGIRSDLDLFSWKALNKHNTAQGENIPLPRKAAHFSPPAPLGFVFSSPCSPSHRVTQSTVVHSRVWCLHWGFLQVEGAVTRNKSGLKTLMLCPLACFRALQEELRSFVEILDVPEKIGIWNRGLVSAVQGPRRPLWDSHWAFCLVDWVSIGPSYKRITFLCYKWTEGEFSAREEN